MLLIAILQGFYKNQGLECPMLKDASIPTPLLTIFLRFSEGKRAPLANIDAVVRDGTMHETSQRLCHAEQQQEHVIT